MKVILPHQKKVIEIHGKKEVRHILKELNINPESALVIKDKNLLTPDVVVEDSETIEIRYAISGGGIY